MTNNDPINLLPSKRIIDTIVWTLNPSLSVLDAVHLLNQQAGINSPQSIGNQSNEINVKNNQGNRCILVVEENRFVGILTPWDLVKLAAAGVDLSSIAIGEVMQSSVITRTPRECEQVLATLSLMEQHNIGHLPVVDEQQQLIGVVTQDRIREVLQPAHLLQLRSVGEVMETQVLQASPETAVQALAQQMSEHQARCVVIVEPAKPRGRRKKVPHKASPAIPIGIVTAWEIVQLQSQLMNLAQTQAGEVMSTPLVTIKVGDSLWVADQLMRSRSLSQVVVVGEEGQLQGLLSQKKLLEVFDPLEMARVIEVLRETSAEQTAQLRQMNQQLQQEVLDRQQAEQSVQQIYLRRVEELLLVNEELEITLEELQSAQEELRLQNEELEANRLTLQVERQRYEDLFELAPDGYLVTDIRGNIREGNQAATSLLGVEKRFLMGKPLVLFVPPYQRPEFYQRLGALEPVQDWELALQPRNQAPLLAMISLTPIQTAKGHITGLRWLIRDISDRKQMEQRLQAAHDQLESRVQQRTQELMQANFNLQQEIEQNRQAQQQLTFQSNILAQLSDAVIAIDQSEKITYWNHSAERLYGVKATEILEQSLQGIYQYEWLNPTDEQTANQALRTIGFWQGENIHIKRNGERIYVESSVSVLKNDQGVAVGMLAVIRDISDRKQLEAALRASEGQLNDVLDSAIALISSFRVFANGDWEYEYFSAGSERLFGYKPEELIADKTLWPSRVHRQDWETVMMPLFADFLAQRSVTKEYRFIHKNNSQKWINTTYTSRYHEAENYWQITSVSTDITDRKEAELSLKKQLEREHLIAEITEHIRQTLDVNEVLQRTVDQVRHFLETDRVIIFRFQSNLEGTVIMESVAKNYLSIDATLISDPCFAENYVELYRQGRVCAIADLQTAEVNPCYRELLTNFQVRANLVVPIFQGENLWGLLIAQHCSAAREWHPEEIELLRQLSNQVGIAIQQSELYQQTRRELLERRRMQEILEESEERFRSLSASAPIGIRQMNADGICLYANTRWEIMSGFTEQDSFGDGWTHAIHPEDRATVIAAWNAAIDHAQEFFGEYRLLTPQGKVRWVSAHAAPMRSATGEIIGYVSTEEDISDRKQAELDLWTTQQQLQSILDNSPAAMYLIDAENKHLLVNRSYTQILSTTAGNILGKSIYDFWPPEIADPFATNNQQVLTNNALLQTEEIAPHSDGLHTYFTLKFPIHDLTGKPYAVCGISTDITELKQTTEALKQSESTLRSFFNSASQMMGIIELIDEDLRIITCNSAAANFFGATPEALAQKLASEIGISQPDREHWCDRSRQAQRNQAPVHFEYAYHRDRRQQWLLITICPIPEHFGEYPRFAFLAEEITERRQAEQKIRQQAALIDIATDAIFVQDMQNQIRFWSKGAERLYGWTAAEALQQETKALFYKQPLSQLELAWNATLQQGFWQGEIEQVTKSGQDILVASRWALVRDQAGQPKSILVVNTDITEKKNLEAQFFRAQRLESIGTLASGIAHDLNNIFTPMLTLPQLIALKLLSADDQIQEMLETLTNSARRGANLVKQVLTFARGSDGKHISLQVQTALEEVVMIMKQTFPKSIEIVTHLPENSLWSISADPTQLHQVLMNLCVNARDAMPKGGTLTLIAENRRLSARDAKKNLDAQAGNYVVITVSDTGTGIPPKILDRIFDPFFTTKDTGQGTGLGLSTVLGIVKNHGGFVQVSSEVDRGTQFKIYLPAIEESPTDTQEPEALLLGGHGELILIVDDEITVQQTTRALLESYHYQTLVASDGVEAIARYSKHQNKIDLVLVDIMMPNMGGFTLMRTLKNLNPDIKMIAASGLPANKKEAIAAGASTFLAKPYSQEELLIAIHHLIATKKLSRSHKDSH